MQSCGIKQISGSNRDIRDKTMHDKLVHIPNDNKQITPSVDLNNWLKSLNNNSFEQANPIS